MTITPEMIDVCKRVALAFDGNNVLDDSEAVFVLESFLALSATQILETELTPDQIAKIHSFGECWIKDYQGRSETAAPSMRRDYFKKALRLWAWDRRVIFADGPHSAFSEAALREWFAEYERQQGNAFP